MNTIEKVRYLVSEAKTKEALHTLVQFFKDKNEDLQNECILYSGRINKSSQDFRLGLVDYGSVLQISNQINYSILTILKEVEKLEGIKDNFDEDDFDISRNISKKELTVFFSYSHRDKDLRERLEIHISALKKYRNIKTWYDREILPGKDWSNEIKKALYQSNIILLLVSADFLASDFCNLEIDISVKRMQEGAAIVIPIILKPCLWKETELADLQALPLDGKPITTWSNRDEAFANIAEGVRKVVMINQRTK